MIYVKKNCLVAVLTFVDMFSSMNFEFLKKLNITFAFA